MYDRQIVYKTEVKPTIASVIYLQNLFWCQRDRI